MRAITAISYFMWPKCFSVTVFADRHGSSKMSKLKDHSVHVLSRTQQKSTAAAVLLLLQSTITTTTTTTTTSTTTTAAAAAAAVAATTATNQSINHNRFLLLMAQDNVMIPVKKDMSSYQYEFENVKRRCGREVRP